MVDANSFLKTIGRSLFLVDQSACIVYQKVQRELLLSETLGESSNGSEGRQIKGDEFDFVVSRRVFDCIYCCLSFTNISTA